jgi:hypothetical protein
MEKEKFNCNWCRTIIDVEDGYCEDCIDMIIVNTEEKKYD